MQKAKLTVTTKIDNEAENSAVYDAEMELNVVSAVLWYRENQSNVQLTLKDNELFIERTGDYNFKLRLRESQILPASLGFGDSCGEIFLQTHDLKFSITNSSLLLSTEYDLCFSGEEKQKMKLRIYAKSVTEEK